MRLEHTAQMRVAGEAATQCDVRNLGPTVLQEMRGARWSDPLVVAGLLNPVIPIRNAALHAAARMPPDAWGDPVARALRRLAHEEPLDDVRERALAQLARAR